MISTYASHGMEKQVCYLGVKSTEVDISGSYYFTSLVFSNSTCNFGFAVAYVAVIDSLAMICGELFTHGRLVTRQVTLGMNRSTLVLLMALVSTVLWVASLIYSIWAFVVTCRSWDKYGVLPNYLPSKSDLTPPVAFYIIFHSLSVTSWVESSCQYANDIDV